MSKDVSSLDENIGPLVEDQSLAGKDLQECRLSRLKARWPVATQKQQCG